MCKFDDQLYGCDRGATRLIQRMVTQDSGKKMNVASVPTDLFRVQKVLVSNPVTSNWL
jgi:hypothetical protein